MFILARVCVCVRACAYVCKQSVMCVHASMHISASVYLRLELLSIRKTPLQLCKGRRIAAKTEKNILKLEYITTGCSKAGQSSLYYIEFYVIINSIYNNRVQ